MVDLRSCPFCGGNEIIIRPVYYAGIVNTKTSWLSELPDLRAAIGPRGFFYILCTVHIELPVGPSNTHREAGKAIFGGGLLLSDRAAAERAAAERAAAERAAATEWQLSPRELQMVAELGGGHIGQ